jgi:hypothetical protein
MKSALSIPYYCVKRLLFFMYCFLAPVDVALDIYNAYLLAAEQWWFTFALSFLVYYLSARFVFLYGAMLPPPKPLYRIWYMYMPFLLLPHWDLVVSNGTAREEVAVVGSGGHVEGKGEEEVGGGGGMTTKRRKSPPPGQGPRTPMTGETTGDDVSRQFRRPMQRINGAQRFANYVIFHHVVRVYRDKSRSYAFALNCIFEVFMVPFAVLLCPYALLCASFMMLYGAASTADVATKLSVKVLTLVEEVFEGFPQFLLQLFTYLRVVNAGNKGPLDSSLTVLIVSALFSFISICVAAGDVYRNSGAIINAFLLLTRAEALKAVEANGLHLQLLSETLKDDLEIVRAACKQIRTRWISHPRECTISFH